TRNLPTHVVLGASTAAAAAALACMPWVRHPGLLVALMVVIGLGLGLGQPLTMAWVAARAPKAMRGLALGIRLSGNRLGQLVLPAAAGLVFDALGMEAMFWSVGALLAISAVIAVRRPL